MIIMKNPTHLLRMARRLLLFCGSLTVLTPVAFAQEHGTASKAEPVDFSSLAKREKQSPSLRRTFAPTHKRLQKEPLGLPVSPKGAPVGRSALATAMELEEIASPTVLTNPSPSASASFVALPDDGHVVPPDTHGAVGPSHLVVACASDLRVQDRN